MCLAQLWWRQAHMRQSRHASINNKSVCIYMCIIDLHVRVHVRLCMCAWHSCGQVQANKHALVALLNEQHVCICVCIIIGVCVHVRAAAIRNNIAVVI